MKNIFSDHLNDENETYWCHLLHALCFTLAFIVLAMIYIIHGIFPCLFANISRTYVSNINSAVWDID